MTKFTKIFTVISALIVLSGAQIFANDEPDDYDVVDLNDDQDLGISVADLLKEIGKPLDTITDKKATLGLYDSIITSEDEDGGINLFFIKGNKVAATTVVYYYDSDEKDFLKKDFADAIDEIKKDGFAQQGDPDKTDADDVLFKDKSNLYVYMSSEDLGGEDGYELSITYAQDISNLAKLATIVEYLDNTYEDDADE